MTKCRKHIIIATMADPIILEANLKTATLSNIHPCINVKIVLEKRVVYQEIIWDCAPKVLSQEMA